MTYCTTHKNASNTINLDLMLLAVALAALAVEVFLPMISSQCLATFLEDTVALAALVVALVVDSIKHLNTVVLICVSKLRCRYKKLPQALQRNLRLKKIFAVMLAMVLVPRLVVSPPLVPTVTVAA